MKSKWFARGAHTLMAFLVSMGLFASSARARDTMELESRYMGNGWFDYTLRTLEDPFFTAITFNQLSVSFNGFVTNLAPAGWYGASGFGGIYWDHKSPQPRINEIKFSVKSSYSTFRRQPNAFTSIINLTFADRYHWTGGAGGYVSMDSLVPCTPEQADGSPEVLVFRRELIPDIKIDDMIVTNGEVRGVTFSWNQSSTVELQGSFDMSHWTTIAWIYGDAPRTTWTTNNSLNPFGKFFRLSLVGFSHVPLPTTGLALSAPEPSLPFVVGELRNGLVQVNFPSTPGLPYVVEAYEWPGSFLASAHIDARSELCSVTFNKALLGKTVFFKVRRR